MVGIGGIISSILGKESMARQFFVWNIAASVVNTAMKPYLTALESDVNARNPLVPLTPADLADMVIRGIVARDEAAGVAAKSGVDGHDFDLLVQNTGEPPSIIDMLQLLRRGQVDRDAVVRAIKQSHVRDEWVDTVLMLGIQPPTPTDILDAAVKGQISREAAHELYAKLGGDPQYFDLTLNTIGDGPTPIEAARMANKGLIPWDGEGPGVISFTQAVKESHYRDKWLEAYRKDAEYFPPPRTITAMYHSGALTKEQSADLLSRQGLSPTLVAAYLSDASKQKTTKFKELTVTVIGELYQDQAIGDDEARNMLEKLKYEPAEAGFIILTFQMQREQKFRSSAIGTVHTQYINHKIDQQKASTLLDSFHVPPNQRDYLLALWNQEQSAKVVLLTPAEIKKAVNKNLLTYDEGKSRLVLHGFSPDDADIYLII